MGMVSGIDVVGDCLRERCSWGMVSETDAVGNGVRVDALGDGVRD